MGMSPLQPNQLIEYDELKRKLSIKTKTTCPVNYNLHPKLKISNGRWFCHDSRLDYGSATLVGLPAYQINRLQSVFNAAARLVYSSRRYEYDHVTPLLRELHWLRMSQRIDYKLAVLVYRCLNGLAPSYLANDLRCVADLDARRCLRSASTSTLVVPVNSRRQRVCGGRGSRVDCGTVCRPMSLRRHLCRHSRDG